MAVGLALEERRPFAAAGAADRLERRLAHRPQVVSVHHLRLHPERRRADPDLAARRDARHRRELAVEVVLADEHERQVEHLRPVEALVEVPLVRGAVAEEGDRDPALALRGDRGPGGRGDAAAHDPEAAHEAVLEVDHVHRARAAAADPGRRARASRPRAPPGRCPSPARGRGRGRCRRRSRPARAPSRSPTGTASWPAERCVVPCTSPFRNRRWISSSKRRMRRIRP